MQQYDLHCHSSCSDGRLSPAELVLRASAQGVTHLALTDHDTMAGVAAARAAIAAQQLPLELITGVELSCRWHNHEIHLVALNLPSTAPALLDLLQAQQQRRRDRYQAMLARLSYLSLAVEPPVLDPETMPTRKHLADALVEQGKVSSVEAAFQRYLGEGKLAYRRPDWVSLADAIAIVNASGGSSVLAHPHAYQLSTKWLKRLLSEGKEAGLMGLEVAIGQQAPQQRQQLAQLAEQFELYASVGSDFHAPLRFRELGKNLCLPPQCVPIWQAWNSINA